MELGSLQVRCALRTFEKSFYSIFFFPMCPGLTLKSWSIWDICIPHSPWWEQQSHPKHGGDADSEPDPDLGTLISLSDGLSWDLQVEESQKASAGAQKSGTRHSEGDRGQLEPVQGRAAGMIGAPANMTSRRDGKSWDCLVWRGDERREICWECVKGDWGKEENLLLEPTAHKMLGYKSRSRTGGEGWSWWGVGWKSQEGENLTKRPGKKNLLFIFYFFSSWIWLEFDPALVPSWVGTWDGSCDWKNLKRDEQEEES